MQVTHLKDIKHEGFDVQINIVESHYGCNWLNDLYTPSEHVAGTTIQVPQHLQSRHGHKHFIGQYLPSDLARDYAKQGKENPSKAAYESLQNELGHYITADTCWLSYLWFKNGVEVETFESCRFDYSYEFSSGTLEAEAEHILLDYGQGNLEEGLEEAIGKLNKMREALA